MRIHAKGWGLSFQFVIHQSIRSWSSATDANGLSLAEMRVGRSAPFVEPNLDAVHRSEITFLRRGGSTEPRSRQDVRTMRFPGAFRGGNLVLNRFSPAWLRVVTMLHTQYVQSVNDSKEAQRHRVVQHRWHSECSV